jgi:hypothetical protein
LAGEKKMNNISKPDFYLSSSENYDLNKIRNCYVVKRLAGDHRDDFLLVQVDPIIELNGSEYKIPFNKIEKVILATRHKGYTLFPITEWPAYVFVMAALVDRPEELSFIHDNQMKMIAWAELYEQR